MCVWSAVSQHTNSALSRVIPVPMFFLCFIRYLSIWITVQRQYIQSRGMLGGPIRFRAARIVPMGSNCPLSCSCQSHGKPWETTGPWDTSARGNPPKSMEKVLKRKANETQAFQITVEETIISEGSSWTLPWLLCLKSHKFSFCFSLGRHWEQTFFFFFFALGEQTVIFLMTEEWSSLPHHQVNDWNSRACKDGLGSHLSLF